MIKYKFDYLEFHENLRMRLLMDMGKVLGKNVILISRRNRVSVLDHLITYHSDDASSIKIALKVIIDS
jgi:hypothetical protein